MGADNDMIASQFVLPEDGHKQRRIKTGTRVLISKPPPVETIDQHTPRDPRLPAHRTSERAGGIGLANRRGLLSESKGFETSRRLETCTQSTKASTPILERREGTSQLFVLASLEELSEWETNLASHLETDDPHQALHQHYSHIFIKGNAIHICSTAPLRSKDISVEELQSAAAKVKMGKSEHGDLSSNSLSTIGLASYLELV